MATPGDESVEGFAVVPRPVRVETLKYYGCPTHTVSKDVAQRSKLSSYLLGALYRTLHMAMVEGKNNVDVLSCSACHVRFLDYSVKFAVYTEPERIVNYEVSATYVHHVLQHGGVIDPVLADGICLFDQSITLIDDAIVNPHAKANRTVFSAERVPPFHDLPISPLLQFNRVPIPSALETIKKWLEIIPPSAKSKEKIQCTCCDEMMDVQIHGDTLVLIPSSIIHMMEKHDYAPFAYTVLYCEKIVERFLAEMATEDAPTEQSALVEPTSA